MVPLIVASIGLAGVVVAALITMTNTIVAAVQAQTLAIRTQLASIDQANASRATQLLEAINRTNNLLRPIAEHHYKEQCNELLTELARIK